MLHHKEIIAELDRQAAGLMERQLLAEDDSRFGGFWRPNFFIESRDTGFMLSKLVTAYVTPDSRWYLNEQAGRAISAALHFVRAHQRPSGCFDLQSCNFGSAPDTAFTVNAMLSGWQLLKKCAAPEADWIRAPYRELIDTACTGIAAGGFHTPNHRWAISAALKTWAKESGREELSLRADEYLREGLDINEDGEFAERSSGTYNCVNDDQMIRLYLVTGDRTYLDAAARNLEMMAAYIDPDGSVFTNNSTRQDMGTKVYTEGYFILYLLVGYLGQRPEFGAMAEWIWQDARRRGRLPLDSETIQWLLLFPEMDGYGADADFAKPFENYSRLFPASDIARVRRGNWSYTLLRGKANFLYFQHGSFSMYATIYSNVCDRRNFLAKDLERTENGWRMTAHARGWYYLPFPEKPETSDWWAMDNPHTRPMMDGLPLDTLVEIVEQPDGIDLHIKTEGLDQVPLRLELAFLPGGYVRTEHFILDAVAGQNVHVMDGVLEAGGPAGETIVVGPCFNEHCCQYRMGGAYPLSQSHYTVFLNTYTPVDRVISIRAAKKDHRL